MKNTHIHNIFIDLEDDNKVCVSTERDVCVEEDSQSEDMFESSVLIDEKADEVSNQIKMMIQACGIDM